MTTCSLHAFLRGIASASPRISGSNKIRISVGIAIGKRSLSSQLDRFQDPSKYVVGVNKAQLDADPVLQAYFLANFPEEVQDPMGSEGAVPEGTKIDPLPLDPLEASRSALNIRTMHCFKRDPVTEEGTKRCYRLRDKEAFIPGLLYGGDPTQNITRPNDPGTKTMVKTSWSQIFRELTLYHHSFESRVYDLTIYEDEEDKVGSLHRVMPRDMQYHPVVNRIYCLNYLRYHPNRPIKIPLKYLNEEESNALKRGGFIVPIDRFISCIVEEGQPIPEYINVECTGLKLKQTIRIDRLIFPEGVTPSKKVDHKQFLVGSVFGRRSVIGDEKD
jgi:hypothetical protein